VLRPCAPLSQQWMLDAHQGDTRLCFTGSAVARGLVPRSGMVAGDKPPCYKGELSWQALSATALPTLRYPFYSIDPVPRVAIMELLCVVLK